MNNGYIRLKDILAQMDELDANGRPVKFQMKFVTYNRSSGLGGEIIEVVNASKCSTSRNGEVIFDTRPKRETPSGQRKDPAHSLNQTRNIYCENGRRMKIHIRLIIEFNNQKVVF